jgi:hypothetical protein
VIWASVALAWYFLYGIRHSTVGKERAAAAAAGEGTP